MHGLENGRVLDRDERISGHGIVDTYTSNVSRGGQSQPANEPGAHIRQDIAIQVGHDHNPVRVRLGVLHNLQADTVKEVLVIRDAGELLRDLAAGGQEHAVRHFPKEVTSRPAESLRGDTHDVSLVDGGDAFPPTGLGVVEGVACNPLRRVPCNQLDRLDYTVDDLICYELWTG